MQQQLKAEWETYAVLTLAGVEDIESEDLAPTEPPPPRFYKPVRYVRQSVSMLRDFGALPREGGLDQQSAALIRDMLTWLHGQNYQLYLMRKRLDARARERANNG